MRARFIGDPTNGGEGPSGLSLFGVDFVKGEWADVPRQFAAKIAGNSHFETDADDDGKVDPDIEEVRAALDVRGVKYHPKTGLPKLLALLAEQEG